MLGHGQGANLCTRNQKYLLKFGSMSCASGQGDCGLGTQRPAQMLADEVPCQHELLEINVCPHSESIEHVYNIFSCNVP